MHLNTSFESVHKKSAVCAILFCMLIILSFNIESVLFFYALISYIAVVGDIFNMRILYGTRDWDLSAASFNPAILFEHDNIKIIRAASPADDTATFFVKQNLYNFSCRFVFWFGITVAASYNILIRSAFVLQIVNSSWCCFRYASDFFADIFPDSIMSVILLRISQIYNCMCIFESYNI